MIKKNGILNVKGCINENLFLLRWPSMNSIRCYDKQMKQNINHVVFLLITPKFFFHIIHQYDHEGPHALKCSIIVLLSGLRIILILLSTDRGKRQGNRICACFILTSVKTIVQLEHLPVVGWGYLH